MLEKNIREQIIDLIHRQVVPAVGCTEPMAVALCTARATELLGQKPERIKALLSANILKNAMGVGIPGTGMIGLPIAISLGALIGKSEYQLEVIKDLTPESLEEGKQYVAENHIDIKLKSGISEKLYVEITCEAGENKATAIISKTHTNFVYEEMNGKVLLNKQVEAGDGASEDNDDIQLNLKLVWDFATTTPINEIDFILEAKRYNGNSIYSHILSKTASACDARMGGAMVPVMSNSGSGNQGICATNPVVVFAKENGNTPDELVRALTLSHLTAIYIKQNLGTLSALCGCIVACTGSSCGITYLMGGDYNNICYSIKNMIANLTGMVCDGAKPSCALKVSSGVSTAVLSAMLSMSNQHVTEAEGIIDKDIDQSIRNLTSLGKHAMNEMDIMVLDIMTHKNGC